MSEWIALDIVIIPPLEIQNLAIEMNRTLCEKFENKIILNLKDCLPHISLAMGCVLDENIPFIKKCVVESAQKFSSLITEVTGINSEANPTGKQISEFGIKKTKEILDLHVSLMDCLSPYFKYNPKPDMFLTPPPVDPETLEFLKQFQKFSGREGFRPHLTLGAGEIPATHKSIPFIASNVSICRLGNYCTCRQVLSTINL